MIFGWGKKVKELGRVEERQDCQICKTNEPFALTLVFSYFHVLWVPLVCWDFKYLYHCERCGNGYEVTKEQMGLSAHPLGWWYRYSWVVALALVGGFIALIVAG